MKKLAALIAVATVAGCTSLPPATPLEGGLYRVESTGETKDDAQKIALKSAAATCSQRHMRHVVTDESAAYSGLLNEKTNSTLNKAADLVPLLPTLSTDDDYRVTLSFKCEA